MTGVPETDQQVRIDASGIHYRELNSHLKELAGNGVRRVVLQNVYGQRYIGTSLNAPMEIEIHGTPGNDLGAFMDGPKITVYGNAQDGCGNTMNNGEIIVHGHAGDIVGLSARGGRIFVRDNVGYRAGIHMKEYEDKRPMVVIGGIAQDFLGEYMAGGVLLLLGLNGGGEHKARFIGTGMHGGAIYLRGSVEKYQLGREVGVAELDEKDWQLVKKLAIDFAHYFEYNADKILKDRFIKLFPLYLRPYGRIYAH
jgi:glutamate synthase domain-containing protein 3